MIDGLYSNTKSGKILFGCAFFKGLDKAKAFRFQQWFGCFDLFPAQRVY